MAAYPIPGLAGTEHDPRHERPVLVLEDDAAVAATICTALERDGWSTVTAATLAEGRLRLQRDNPRLVIADLGLPDGNGIAFVREAAGHADLGIIVVSGRAEEVDRVIGLEVGADDYLAKPFSLREMVARVRALSRRLNVLALQGTPQQPGQNGLREAQAGAAGPAEAESQTGINVAEPAAWQIAGVALQPGRLRLVAADGSETRLTGAEAGLLALLLNAPDHMADRATISERVLGRRLMPEQRGVDQLASNLRHKLLFVSAGQMTIVAQRGRGYRFVW